MGYIGLLTPANIKRNLKYFKVPVDQQWRVSAVSELMDVRSGVSEVGGFSATKVEDYIEHICSG